MSLGKQTSNTEGRGDGRSTSKARNVSLVDEGKQGKEKTKHKDTQGQAEGTEQSRVHTPIMGIKPDRRTVQAQNRCKTNNNNHVHVSRPRQGMKKKKKKRKTSLRPPLFATTAHAGGSHRSPADAQDTKLACSVGRARWRALALPCFATRPLCIGAARSRSGAVAWAASDAPMAAGVVTGGYGCRGRRRDASGAKRVGGRDGRRRRRGRAGATAQHSTAQDA